MLIHVRTRGRPRKQDYQFLGAAPEDFWWRAYRPVTDIERPTILVRSDGTAWQSYISGITSERLDSTKITIQFNLALAGDCGTGGENALALSVITRAAAGLAQRGGQSIPGDLLDQQLPPDEVERMLDAPGTETLERAADAVRAAYAAPPGPPAEPPPAEPAPPAPAAEDLTTEPAVSDGDWIGGLADAAALDAFTALAARLLGGHRGSALALNLVEAPADLAELPAWDGTVGALSVRPGPHLGMAVRNLGKAGAPPAAAEEERKPGRHRSPRPVPSRKKTLILAGIAVAVVALVIVITWLALNR